MVTKLRMRQVGHSTHGRDEKHV